MAGEQEQVSFILSAKDLTQGAFRSVREGLNGLGGQVASVRGLIATLAGGASVAGFAAMVKGASEAADASAKLGDRFGIVTEKMIGIQYAGQLAGVQSETLSQILRGISVSGTEAARGGEAAARAYERLGINVADFVKLPLDRQLSMIIDRLSKVTNVAERNALAQQTMGKSAGEAMNLVAEGSAAFAAATEEAKAFGLAIDRVEAAKLEMANDAITRTTASSRGLYTQIAVFVSPAVIALANAWADSSKEANGHRDTIKNVVETVVQGVGYAANVVQGLRFAYVAVKFAIAEVMDFTAQAALNMVSFFGKLGEWTQYLPGPIGMVGKLWAGLANTTKETLENIAEATADNVVRIREELDELATQGLPAAKIIERFREVSAAVQKEAEKIARQRATLQSTGEGIEPDAKPGKGGEESWKKQLAQRLQHLREQNMGELELLNEKHRQSNEIIQQALDARIIGENEASAISARNYERWEKATTALKAREERAKLDITASTIGQLSVFMQSKNRALFEFGKAAAVADILIHGASAAWKAFDEFSTYNVYAGYAAAAAVIVATLARANQTASIQIGSGTGAASPVFLAQPGTASPSGPAETPSTFGRDENLNFRPTQREVNITFVGSGRYTQEEIRDSLVPALNDALGDGVVLKVRVDSTGRGI